MIPKIISIDWDGTVVENAYPEIGELRKNAKEVINRLFDEGFVILINTCRAGMYEGEVYKFLVKNQIAFNYINCNLPSQIEHFGMDCRKLSADIYIDDKQLGGIPDDWEVIYELIHKQINL